MSSRRVAFALTGALGCSSTHAADPPLAPQAPHHRASRELAPRWVQASGETQIGPALGARRFVLSAGRLLSLQGAEGDHELLTPAPLEELALVPTTSGFVVVARSADRVYRLEGEELLPVGAPSPTELVALGALPGAALAVDADGVRHVVRLERDGPAPPPLPALPLRASAFVDARLGVVALAGVGLQLTRDGGKTFVPVLDASGAPTAAPDLHVEAPAGGPELVADWYGRARARIDSAGRLGPRAPFAPGEAASPMLRWLAGAGADPLEVAASDGVLLAPTVALAAHAGWVAVVDLERGVVTSAVELAPHGSGACRARRTPRGAVVVCTTEDPALGSRWLAREVLAKPEATSPGQAPGGVQLELGRELVAVDTGGAELPRSGIWMPRPCGGPGEGACVLQPDGTFRSIPAAGVVAALEDGRAVVREERQRDLVFAAVGPTGARSPLGSVSGGAGAPLEALDASGADVVVLLSSASGARAAVLAADRASSAVVLGAAAGLSAGRLVSLEGSTSLVESVDGGSTWSRVALPAALGAVSRLAVGEVGIVAAGARAQAILLGRGHPTAVPSSLAVSPRGAVAAASPPRLSVQCSASAKPGAKIERLARLPVAAALLGSLGAPVGRVAWESGLAEWLDPAATRAGRGSTRFDGPPPWTVAGTGRGSLALLGRWRSGPRLGFGSPKRLEVADLPASSDGALGPLAVSELGVAWAAGTRLFAREAGGPARELAVSAEPLGVGSPTLSGTPAWVDGEGGAWVRWLRPGHGALDAVGWQPTTGLADLALLRPCIPPKGSSRLVAREPLDIGRVELAGARHSASVLPVAAVSPGGAACLEELWLGLREPIAVSGLPVRWLVLSHDRASGLTDVPLERVPLRCERTE